MIKKSKNSICNILIIFSVILLVITVVSEVNMLISGNYHNFIWTWTSLMLGLLMLIVVYFIKKVESLNK